MPQISNLTGQRMMLPSSRLLVEMMMMISMAMTET